MVKEEKIKVVVAHQNIVETVNVFVHRYKYSISTTSTMIKELLEGFQFEVITPLPSTISLFFSLLERVQVRRSIYDIFLAATMIDNNQTNLLTVNEKDFRMIKELRVVNPFQKVDN